MAVKAQGVAVQPAQYRTDGRKLYFVLAVGEAMSWVENCGTPDSSAEEVPTQQLLGMAVVRHGKH